MKATWSLQEKHNTLTNSIQAVYPIQASSLNLQNLESKKQIEELWIMITLFSYTFFQQYCIRKIGSR